MNLTFSANQIRLLLLFTLIERTSAQVMGYVGFWWLLSIYISTAVLAIVYLCQLYCRLIALGTGGSGRVRAGCMCLGGWSGTISSFSCGASLSFQHIYWTPPLSNNTLSSYYFLVYLFYYHCWLLGENHPMLKLPTNGSLTSHVVNKTDL